MVSLFSLTFRSVFPRRVKSFIITTSSYKRARSCISVEPSSSLVDEKVKILVSELDPKQNVTLSARTVGEKGEVFESYAYYVTDEDGKVDVYRDSSLGGSYSGVEPMGLLWSMKQAPGQRKGLRLTKRNVSKPFDVDLTCFDDHISPNEESRRSLSSVRFEKWYMADGVKRNALKDQKFHGTLFIPPGDGPFPGVLDLRGSTPGLRENRTSLLASRGFTALALGYIPPGDSGALPPYFELEYFEEAVDWLCKHPKVSPGGIGIFADSVGSWFALWLASFRSDVIKAVVAVSPLTLALRQLPALKYRGKVSETVPCDTSKLLITKDGVVTRHALPKVTEDNGSNTTYSAITPCENISCPVLLVYGTEDLNMIPDFSAKQVYERMRNNDKGHLCSLLRYPGAGHLFEPPYTPLVYSSFDPVVGVLCGNPYVVLGGDREAHAKAQEDVWPKSLNLLKENVFQV